MSIKNFFKTEIAKLKEMTFTEKRQYIWEYYKFQIVATIFIVVLSSTWIWSQNSPEYLYMAWFSTGSHDENMRRIGQELSVIVPDPDRDRVTVSSYAYTGNPQVDSSRASRFFALLHTNQVDAMFAPRQGIEELAQAEFSRPIYGLMAEVRNISPELYAKVSENIYNFTFVTDDYMSFTNDMAISMANTPLFEYMGIDSSDLYMSVAVSAPNMERLARAIEVIFIGGDASGH